MTPRAELADPIYPSDLLSRERGYVFLGSEQVYDNDGKKQSYDFYAGVEVPRLSGVMCNTYAPSLVVVGANSFTSTTWAALHKDFTSQSGKSYFKDLFTICWQKAREQNVIDENPRDPFAETAVEYEKTAVETEKKTGRPIDQPIMKQQTQPPKTIEVVPDDDDDFSELFE